MIYRLGIAVLMLTGLSLAAAASVLQGGSNSTDVTSQGGRWMISLQTDAYIGPDTLFKWKCRGDQLVLDYNRGQDRKCQSQFKGTAFGKTFEALSASEIHNAGEIRFFADAACLHEFKRLEFPDHTCYVIPEALHVNGRRFVAVFHDN